ncbi:MAG: hypothetical protein HS104_17010 [Polyangiaceae bacterium]|nr:hypothetical protein [Polyangiaceae bacterium]
MRGVVGLSATLVVCSSARAQTVDAAAAETLFQEGRRAFDAGNYESACQKFAESQRLDPGAGTLINLAACQEKLGRLARAWESWQEALRSLPAGDSRRPMVLARAKDIEQRMPRLSIELAAGAPDGIEVKRGGVKLGRAAFGVALPVDTGELEIEVTAPGRKPRRYKVSLAEGATEKLVVEAGEADGSATEELEPKAPPVAAVTPVPAADRVMHRAPDRTLGYLVTGAGAATLAVSAVTGYFALRQKQTMDDRCATVGGKQRCDSEGLDAADRGKTFATISTATFAAGAVVTGLGVYLIVSAKGEPIRVGAGVAPGGGLLTVGGPWAF